MAIVVGIGGVSRAGKTFLAELISQNNTARIVKTLAQDEFVKPIDEIPLIKGHIDWESPASIDFPRFKNAIISAAKESDIVIAEGLLSVYDPEIVNLFSKIIFISLSRDEFKRRKQNDLRWGTEPEWYIQHIWKSYLRFGQCHSDKADILMLSGEEDFNLEEVLKFIGI